jgi:peptide/nickel transport system substrate-binding protein
MVFPGHPLAATKEELEQLAGYWPDIEKSREEARRLLKEAGAENLEFVLNNRAIDQPYTIVGTWLIDQWSKIGVKVSQVAMPSGPFYDKLRSKSDFQVSMDFNCQAVVNPLLVVAIFTSDDKTDNQHGNDQDREMDKLFDAMNQTADVDEQRKLMRQFEKRGLDEQANSLVTVWWYRIIPHRSYLKGWKVSPSHYLNQDLSGVWLDK